MNLSDFPHPNDKGDENEQGRAVIADGSSPSLIYHVEQRLLSTQETGNRNAIFGTVTDAAGAPLQGKTVRMRWTGAAADTHFPTTTTGKDPFKPAGYFEFIHTPGVFMVDVVDDAWASEVAENLITADMPDHPRPICYEVNFALKAPEGSPAPPPPVPVPPPSPEPEPDPEPEPLVLAHYVYLAIDNAQAGLLTTYLHLAMPFILASEATVGFDPAPTQHAARVTVIGPLHPDLAQSLQNAQIRVDQVAADPFTLSSALEALL